MNFDQQNPYLAPQATDARSSNLAHDSSVDATIVKKAETIIKDASQFWLAIVMCFVCTGVGGVIIGPWYLIRLLQWNSLANREPRLLDKNVVRGSLAQRFQTAKIQLIAGVCFGGLALLVVAVAIVLMILG